MEMIRKLKRKLNGVTRLRMLCLFCVIVMFLGVLELVFEVFFLDYGAGPDGKPRMYVYMTSSRHMPIHYWRHRQRYPGRYKEDKNAENCTILPYPQDIQYASPYWQRFLGERFTSYLYTAYWERRPRPRVSINLLSTGLPDQLFCRLWFLDEAAPIQVEADTRLLGDLKPGSDDGSEVQTAYSVHCQLGGKVHKQPVAVSLSDTNDCKTVDNVLTIVNIPNDHSSAVIMGFYKPPPLLPLPTNNNISVGVCVMWPDDEEETTVLVAHWFEMLRVLGAHRIYISISQAHKRVHDIIHFYEQNGLVLKLAKARPLSPSSLLALTREQLVQYERTFRTFIYTDCMYQARELHSYVLMLKPFEIILPDNDDDVWENILIKDSKLLKQPSDAILVDRWNAAGDDESKEEQDHIDDTPYRSFQSTASVTLARLGAPAICADKDGEQRNCKIRRVKKSAKFIPYTAVLECTQSKVASGITTDCYYRPHEKLTSLWYFVDYIATIAVGSLY